MTKKVANGLDLLNRPIINVPDPSAGTDVANKQYVDSVARGLDWKQSVRIASTGNINLAAPGASLDSVAMVANDRFLAKDQTTGSQNGIYVWNGSAVAATRATDADTSAEVTAGTATSVTEGTVNANKTFVLITPDPITLGTTALVFTQLGGGTAVVAGNGLVGTTTFDVGAGTGITVGADTVSVDTSVISRKFAVSIGDGAATSFTITHNFGTRDVVVQVFEISSGDEIITDVNRPSGNTNTVVIGFATAPSASQYRAVVHG